MHSSEKYFMIRFFLPILTSVILTGMFSCQRIKNKGNAIADKAEQTVKDKVDDIADKVIPGFDPHAPDTKHNKKRFREFLKVELTDDIKNIYCFDDAIGIDADYSFAFNCDTGTVARIMDTHYLVPDTLNLDVSALQNDFDWWDKKKIEKLQLYSWTDERSFYKYFWYDTSENKAYYFQFDL